MMDTCDVSEGLSRKDLLYTTTTRNVSNSKQKKDLQEAVQFSAMLRRKNAGYHTRFFVKLYQVPLRFFTNVTVILALAPLTRILHSSGVISFSSLSSVNLRGGAVAISNFMSVLPNVALTILSVASAVRVSQGI